jgi:hypothetical protein
VLIEVAASDGSILTCLLNLIKFIFPCMGWMLAQVVTDVGGGSTASNVVIWGSLISGAGIAGGALIQAWFTGASKYRETDQKSTISDQTHEIERLKEDVEDYKTRWKEEREARLRVEADFERYRASRGSS